MHPEDTSVFASNIIDKYKNWPFDLQSLWFADFVSNYVSKKSDDVPVESDEIKSYLIPVSSIDDIEPNPSTIVLKNKHCEMWKLHRPCVIRFPKVSNLKNPGEHYLWLLQLYMPCRNEDKLKQNNRSYKDRYKEAEDVLWNITKHELYLDIDYEELEIVNVVQWDGEENDNAEFSMIKPDLLVQDLEESNDVSNTPASIHLHWQL